MKITKQQLRSIIRETINSRELEEPHGGFVGDALTGDPDYFDHTGTELEPARFRSKDEAEGYAVDMVFGDDPNQRLGNNLPYEVRIVSIDGEYALYAMKSHTDRYAGPGKVVAAVPRGGSIRYGRKIE
jgi:hypothetical protein